MSVQVLNPDTTAIAEGGLQRWKKFIFAGIIGLPFVLTCLAYVNPDGGYALVGAFCNLPVRPFWYRLFLSWTPRYVVVITIVTLTIIVRIKVKGYQRKLAELQPAPTTVPEEVDEIVDEIIEEESDDETPGSPAKPIDSMTADLEKQGGSVVSQVEVEPLASEQDQFNSNDMPKFKRMSYRRRQLPPLNTSLSDDAIRTNSLTTPSLAPSSAVLSSPRRDMFGNDPFSLSRQSTNLDLNTPASAKPAGGRRSSVADFSTMRSMSTSDVPPSGLERRRSLIDMSTSRSNSAVRQSMNLSSLNGGGADRMNSNQSNKRRSSIWDEIDASLEKKAANRMSIFTITASEAGHVADISSQYDANSRAASPTRDSQMYPSSLARASRVSATNKRQSKMYDFARRTMSIISLRGVEPEEDPDSPAAILRRRHRYIQRQLRYMMFYPLVYISLWSLPFVMHCLQYMDRFAAHPPFPLAVANIVSLTIFGFVNSAVFCLREKPWAVVPQGDGTVRGGLRTDPFVKAVRGFWRDIRGHEGDEMDFAG
ncbi:hypothetical protein ANO11243_083960 [Dothideomycetidae sp. 11243]|nr:hypothetical protein ANO11243_083960 [fungal sp. No.11243]